MSLKCCNVVGDADDDDVNDFEAAAAAAIDAAVGKFCSLPLLYILERFEWDDDKFESLQRKEKQKLKCCHSEIQIS